MSFAVPLLLTMAITGWVAIDAARRGRNWLAWALLVAGTGVLGLIPWLFVRRRSPATLKPLGNRRGAALLLAAIPLSVITVMSTLVSSDFPVPGGACRGQRDGADH